MDRTKAVQGVLNSLGYECGIDDGVYDVETRDAIRRFRSDYGLEISDAIDLELMQKLLEAAGYSKENTESGSKSERKSEAQAEF